MEVAQHLPPGLRAKKLELNSVINRRVTERYTPLNGASTSYGPNNQIEFSISNRNPLDLQSMFLSCKYTPTGASGELDEGPAFLGDGTIEVYIADKLVERIENYGMLDVLLTRASANDSYVQRELNSLSNYYQDVVGGVAPGSSAGRKLVIPMNALGITKIPTYLPLGNNNLRIVIRLGTLAGSQVNGYSTTDFTVSAVSMVVDHIETSEEYKAMLDQVIRSERGLTVPISTIDRKPKQISAASGTVTHNVSYAELQSIFYLLKKPSGQNPTSEAEISMDDDSFLRVKMSGMYLTPTDGYRGYAENYASLRKGFASLHDSAGSTIIDLSGYTGSYTPLAVDCEKISAMPHIIGNGVNTRENSYAVDTEYAFSSVTNNSTLHTFFLHKKLITMANNAVSVSD